MVFIWVLGSVLVTCLLWMALSDGFSELDFCLENNIECDGPLESKLLAQFCDKYGDNVQAVLALQSYIYQRAERGFTPSNVAWHYLLCLAREYCDEKQYFYAVETAKACTLKSEEDLLFPPQIFQPWE